MTDNEKAFEPQVRRYRRHERTTLILFGTVIGFFGVLVIVKPSEKFWFVACGVLFAIACIAGPVLAYLSPLVCPACKSSVDHRIAGFCPECGGAVKAGSWLIKPTCLVCKKALGAAKSRGYTIRFCTCCGVHLHDKGV